MGDPKERKHTCFMCKVSWTPDHYYGANQALCAICGLFFELHLKNRKIVAVSKHAEHLRWRFQQAMSKGGKP